MAEQFEFTKLSEVPIVETASEEANVLLEENGTIRRVPKTEVGGSGMFVVNMIYPTDAAINMADLKAKTSSVTEIIVDKTYDEITEAFNRGENVVMKINIDGMSVMMPLTSIMPPVDVELGVCCFSAIVYLEVITAAYVVVSSDNSVELGSV